MIPEWETNFLYFSDILPKRYPNFWRNLSKILESASINYDFLAHTKDIWCRDYMPIQISQNKFIQFRYSPNYLESFEELKTDPSIVVSSLKIPVQYSDLIIDGGNIVFSKDAAILTDKIFLENKRYEKAEIINSLRTLLDIDNIYIIPKQPYDIYGHVDGMIRFLSDNTILINDFSQESRTFRKKLEKSLAKMPFRIFVLNIPFKHKLSWCYINYIHISNILIVPIINHPKEEKVLYQFEDIFKECKILSVFSKEILVRGGGLHCISWNIKISKTDKREV